MLRLLRTNAATVEEDVLVGEDFALAPDVVWIDLLDPTLEEERSVERALGLLLPTREEMQEIEASSRLYQEDDATFMTAMVLYNAEAEVPASGPVTFVLAGNRLVTIRYSRPKSFDLFAANVERQPALCRNAPETFLNLLEAIVDRTADHLERTAAEVEAISREVFGTRKAGEFQRLLNRLGRNQNANAKMRDSLVSLARLMGFATLADPIEHDHEARAHLKSLQRDVQSLTDYSSYVSSNIAFVMDATLGLINIEQNAIIKIFSVASVAFLPPTLIASIYGMNFDHMPELHEPIAYPLAVLAMILSAVIPLLWFRKKGWL